jgi:hypothetical protein
LTGGARGENKKDAMSIRFERTCWRGLEIEHPADWEVSSATACPEPARLALSDRRRERLDMRWRTLSYEPRMESLLAAYVGKEDGGARPRRMDDLSAGWHGAKETVSGVCVVRAGRFFPEARMLVEATFAWPGQRDAATESRLLSSVRPLDSRAADRPWQAMRMRATLPSSYDLFGFSSTAGLTEWRFGTAPGKPPSLTLRQLTMPRYWLRIPIDQWLRSALPGDSRVLRSGPAARNGHEGAECLSRGRAGWRRLAGQRTLRLDVAWLCPVEQRVYHATRTVTGRGREVTLPESFRVECCNVIA